MPINPQNLHLLDTHLQTLKLNATHTSQHGRDTDNRCDRVVSPLLVLPSESLTHITSFLDPKSLFALGRASKLLHEHVSDDNIWHRAFTCQFLGEGQDAGKPSESHQNSLLRRSEDSWKKEFVHRCNLLRRWERSRNATVSHTPHYSPVASMHLMPDRSHGPALLTSSLQYGVVARSLALTGKVLKGYLGASDNGIGIGNPNVEFTPNVSACAIVNEGWSAKIAWGYTNGEVAVTTGNRVMDAGRTVSKLVRCPVTDEHIGKVVEVKWALGGAAFLSAGVDGTVKVWDAKRMKCVWVLNDQESMVPDPCVLFVASLERGFVVALKQSGTAVMWTGVMDISAERPVESLPNIATPAARIPTPTSFHGEARRNVKLPVQILMDPDITGNSVTFAVLHDGDHEFYRVNFELRSGLYERIQFTKGPLGPLRTLHSLSKSGNESMSVILAGDQLGRVSLYNWSAQPTMSTNGIGTVPSFRRLDAHDDGAITSMMCNSYVIVTGSSRGTTKVWDSLTLSLLRSFPSPAAKPEVGREWDAVSGIVLERDLLIVSVGSRVMAWKADSVKPHKAMKAKGHAKTRAHGIAKWHKRIEMNHDITESRLAAADEHSHDQRQYARQRAQLSSLGDLGLDEIEAVEYVLMLSRDEEEARRISEMTATGSRGVFDDDFDDIPAEFTSSQFANGRVSTPIPSIPSPPSGSRPSTVDLAHIVSPTRIRSSHSSSPGSTKVLVTPPFRPEPMEAGFSTSPLGIGLPPAIPNMPSAGDTSQFPLFGSSVSGSGSGSGGWSAGSSSTSPRVSPGASVSWSALLKGSGDKSGGQCTPSGLPARISNTQGSSSGGSVWRALGTPPSGPSLLSTSLRLHAAPADDVEQSLPPRREADEDEDADLKLAIELSLAEALSREA